MKRLFGAALLIISVFLGWCVLSAGESFPDNAFPVQSSKVIATDGIFTNIPLYFIPNQGQVDGEARYYARTSAYTLWLTPQGLVFDSRTRGKKENPREKERTAEKPDRGMRDVSRLVFMGANPNPEIVAVTPTDCKVNYLIGNDPGKWHANITAFGEVLYKDLYPHIDLRVHGLEKQVEYDWIVRPGGDPLRIRFACRGVEGTSLTAGGDLLAKGRLGEILHKKPVCSQPGLEARTGSVPVSARFLRLKKNEWGFAVGEYDRNVALVIDPLVLVHSTYLGGSERDYGTGIALAPDGCVVVSGNAASADFPLQGAYQSVKGAEDDIFVAKFNAAGNGLLFSTFVGGNKMDFGRGLALDITGCAYVTGMTESSDFPTRNPFQADQPYDDAFVFKLNSQGNDLVYSTHLGGNHYDEGMGIALDASGCAYVVGETQSSDFPTKNPIQSTHPGIWNDFFITKLNADGSDLVYSTYLGGSDDEDAYGIAVDSSGCAAVVGATDSGDFPTHNPLMPFQGDWDLVVCKLSADGGSLIFSTYLGGSGMDRFAAVAVDAAGAVYVAGNTSSSDFPAVKPLAYYFSAWSGFFVTKIDPNGDGLIYSTFLGGGARGFIRGITVDDGGCAIITGDGGDLPLRYPLQSSPGGGGDAFITRLNRSGTAILYSTYLGGSDYDRGEAICVDGAGAVYLAGSTISSDFPTRDPFMGRQNDFDAFVCKIAPPLTVSGIISLGGDDGDIPGEPLAGLPGVQLTGLPGEPVTDARGFYSVEVPPGWSGTVTPTYAGASFSPAGRTYAELAREQLDQDYQTAAALHVVDFESEPRGSLAGETPQVVAHGADCSAVTAVPSFGYHFVNWTGSGGFVSTDNPLVVTNVTAHLTIFAHYAINYYSISGHVTRNGQPLAGVRLRNLPGNPLTDSSGYYSAMVQHGWGDVIFPEKESMVFDPPSVYYSSAVSDYSQDYQADFYNASCQNVVLPEVIWAPATGGGTWVSEVQVTDVTGGSVVAVFFNGSDGQRRGPFPLWSGTGPGRSGRFSNVLSTLAGLDPAYGYYGMVGALELQTQDRQHEILVSARTVNGHYSKTFPGLNPAAAENTRLYYSLSGLRILDLSNNDRYRSTCGLFNPTEYSIPVALGLVSPAGSIGRSFEKSVPAHGFVAFDPFAEARVPYPAFSCDSARLELSEPFDGPIANYGNVLPGSTGRWVMLFGATADNQSNDPAAHLALSSATGVATSPRQVVVLPEVIWAAATGGGTWESDVQVLDASGGSQVWARFFYGNGLWRGPFLLWTNPTSYKGSGVSLANVLAQLAAMDNGFDYRGRVGALELSTPDSSHLIQATARTKNGNYSKTFPGQSLLDCHTVGSDREMAILDLASDTAYRSTCGLYNPDPDTVTVTCRLLDGDGQTIGQAFDRTLVGHDYQAFDPFAAAGAAYPGQSHDNVVLLLSVAAGDGRAMAFGASANNVSNDPAAHIAVQYR